MSNPPILLCPFAEKNRVVASGIKKGKLMSENKVFNSDIGRLSSHLELT